MESKFNKLHDSLGSFLSIEEYEYYDLCDGSYCISSKTGLITSSDLRRIFVLCDSLGLSFYVRLSSAYFVEIVVY